MFPNSRLLFFVYLQCLLCLVWHLRPRHLGKGLGWNRSDENSPLTCWMSGVYKPLSVGHCLEEFWLTGVIPDMATSPLKGFQSIFCVSLSIARWSLGQCFGVEKIQSFEFECFSVSLNNSLWLWHLKKSSDDDHHFTFKYSEWLCCCFAVYFSRPILVKSATLLGR